MTDSWDEELPQQPRPPANGLRWTLAAAAVVLAGGALIARNVNGHHHDAAPSPTVSVSAAPSTFDDVVSATPREPTAAPRPDSAVPSCAPDAHCSIVQSVPEGVSAAFARYLPQVRVAQVVSVLAQRVGRFGPDLQSRTIAASDGRRTVTVFIRKPRHTDVDGRHSEIEDGSTVSRVVRVSAAFTVAVEVREPEHEQPVVLATLATFVADGRLVAPQ